MSDTFYYQPGPAGSGKTYQLAHWAAERAAAGEKVLVAQPTRELIRDTARMVRKLAPDATVTVIFGNTVRERVVSRAIEHMEGAKPHQGEILFVTHQTLKRLPTNMRKFWHMVCDEVPGVMEHIDLRVARTHTHVTAHIDASELLVDGLVLLKPLDRTKLEEVRINDVEDQNIASFERLASTILSGEHLVLVGQEAYRDLIENPVTRGRIDVFAILLPDFVRGYMTTTFMGANIEDSEMFVIWSTLLDINWVLHPDMGGKLRYTAHQNGDRLTISYLMEGRLSKRFLVEEDEQGETTLDRLTDFIARFWQGLPFLWQANKAAMPSGFAYDDRLPGVSHGLDKDHWKRYHNVALMAAMNRKSAAYGFLAKLGIEGTQAQATLAWQNDYQAMMRCSLRDPASIAPVRVIVGSKEGAEWIASKFPGCVVEKLDHGIAEPRKRGGQALEGRPSKAKTGAERAREYRERKKAAK